MSKSTVENKEGFLSRTFKGLKSEWMKIIFPTNEQILNDSITVLVCSVIIGLIIFAFDLVISTGFGYLFNR